MFDHEHPPAKTQFNSIHQKVMIATSNLLIQTAATSVFCLSVVKEIHSSMQTVQLKL